MQEIPKNFRVCTKDSSSLMEMNSGEERREDNFYKEVLHHFRLKYSERKKRIKKAIGRTDRVTSALTDTRL